MAFPTPNSDGVVRHGHPTVYAYKGSFTGRVMEACRLKAVAQEQTSQAVARIADRTASQHHWGSLTSSVT